MPRMTLSSLRLVLAGGTAALLLAGLVACAPGAEQPAGSGTAQSGTGTSSGGSEKDLDEWRLAYAECMRGEGIDMPDPGKDGSQTMTKTDGMDEAAAVCEKKLGKPPVGSGADDETARNAGLETMKCLREHGYDAEDPQAGKPMRIPDGLTAEDAEACGIQGFGGN